MNDQKEKSVFLSKTNWTNLIIALAAFFPAAQNFIAENPQAFMLLFAIANIILRLVTKDKLVIK